MLNAVKHSGASSVDLYSEVENGRAMIHVRDRGLGFDPEAVHTRGLTHSLSEPIRSCGGTVSINSVEGEGTEIVIEVPVA